MSISKQKMIAAKATAYIKSHSTKHYRSDKLIGRKSMSIIKFSIILILLYQQFCS